MLTTVKCPYCGDEEKGEFKPPKMFEGFQHKVEDGKWVQVNNEAIVACDKCHKRFVYRLVAVVVCETSKLEWQQ